MKIIKMTSLDLAGKRVLIREDLNVPIKDGEVTSDARIRAALPTIQAALTAKARVMLMSHLGRPEEGKFSEEFSLEPVAKRLTEQGRQKVLMASLDVHRTEEGGEGVVVKRCRDLGGVGAAVVEFPAHRPRRGDRRRRDLALGHVADEAAVGQRLGPRPAGARPEEQQRHERDHHPGRHQPSPQGWRRGRSRSRRNGFLSGLPSWHCTCACRGA